MTITLNTSLKIQGLDVARGIADWVCNLQSPWIAEMPSPGIIPFEVNDSTPMVNSAPEWNYAFLSMGLASAWKTFKDERYKIVCDRLMQVLSSYQILDPFHLEHFGAIREHSPLCPWCYTRDGISGGWGFLEYYRFTQNPQYLKRAELFGEWVTKKGLDSEGYPWFGVLLDPTFDGCPQDHIKNDVQGNFQGGALNFFYQMYKETGDKKWASYMKPIADIFVDYVQQENGYFVSILRDTKKPVPSNDPYAMLHRGNDDLGTIGLLGMHRLSNDKKYLAAIEKFLNAVWADQRADAFFENSVAASPVIINVTWQMKDLLKLEKVTSEKFNAAIEAMLNARCDGFRASHMRGALREHVVSDVVQPTMRANGYALITLLKLFAGRDEYLCA
jgi:uncharacterized protein YyaL (SSP411 family)